MFIKRDGAPGLEEPGALMLSDAGQKRCSLSNITQGV